MWLQQKWAQPQYVTQYHTRMQHSSQPFGNTGTATTEEPSDAASSAPPRAEQGRAIGVAEKQEHNTTLWRTALGLASDEQCRSVTKYCRDHHREHLRRSLSNVIASEDQIRAVTQGKRRASQPELVSDAIAAVYRWHPWEDPRDTGRAGAGQRNGRQGGTRGGKRGGQHGGVWV